MAAPEQLSFVFASLDFPGRTTIGLGEIAERLGCSVDHLLNEVERGALVGVDLKGAKATRRFVRVPLETYRAYVLSRMTGEFRTDFIAELPRATRLQLLQEIEASFAKEGKR
jgi:hypothetical protein